MNKALKGGQYERVVAKELSFWWSENRNNFRLYLVGDLER